MKQVTLFFFLCLFSLSVMAAPNSGGAVPDLVVVDINTAPAEEIAAKLSGVGMAKAKAIVAYRESFGPFVKVEQLTEVKGIGVKIVELNEGRLRLESVSDVN